MFGQMYRPFYGPMYPMYGHHFLGFFFAIALAGLVIGVLYILTLRRALLLCAPQNRAASPDSAWLLLIPLFNLVWQFVLYPRISLSLEREFRQRGLPIERDPARSLGLAVAILHVCSFVLRFLAGFAFLVCFVLCWSKISGYARQLEANSAAVPLPAAPGQWSSQSQVQGGLCSHCGSPLQSGAAFCPNCGNPVS